MIYDRFVAALNTMPLLAPVDIAAVATNSAFFKLGGSHGGTLFLYFGNIAAASADQAVTVTLEAATTNASGSEAAVAFRYRKSGPATENTWGAITSALAAGASVGTTDDGKILAIEINPSEIQTAKTDASHARVVITPDAGGTATLVAAWVQLEPRYSQLTHVSAT